MVDVAQVLDAAGLTNPAVIEYVQEWADVTRPDRIEVVSASDDARLLQEALDAGELEPAGEGLYYSRSYWKDTARSEERTIVATSNPDDQGVYNNWRHSDEIKPIVIGNMTGASEGKTMYVIPYLMSAPGSPLEEYAAGIELTDNRKVVLQMIRMARVGVDTFNALADPTSFVRAVHVTGDLENLGQGTPDDKRYFVTVADERTILHFGSSYGGNALLGKIAHGLRQANWDGGASGKFLGEQYMLIAIHDKQTGKKYHIAGGFPSASGKTNLAMMVPPNALGDRYYVEFFGDDIAWMWVGDDGKLYGMNPEFGVFGVAIDTNEKTNPNALAAVQPKTGAIFTNTAYHVDTHETWWEGKTPDYPTDVSGWRDWKGALISERPQEQQRSKEFVWAHPNCRFTSTMSNVPNESPDYNDPKGVPIDGIIYGGRTRDREPLIRAIDDPAEGVYDGLTLGAEATAAAEGVAGQLRYDPMSMRPFLALPEGRYAQHFLNILDQLTDKPLFAHVNWFQRDADGGYLWPGYGENLRALLWMMDYREGRATGTQTPVGVVPTKDELNLDGLDIDDATMDKLLAIDVDRWKQEIELREAHLKQFKDLPQQIWDAHNRVAKALDDEA